MWIVWTVVDQVASHSMVKDLWVVRSLKKLLMWKQWGTRVTVLLTLVVGASFIMIGAGFYLKRRRRRYRAVTMAKSSYIDIPSTPMLGNLQSQDSIAMPSFGPQDQELDQTPEELFRQGQEAFARAISLWERGLGQVNEAQGHQQIHPQLATRLRNILRHAYTVQDVYEHISSRGQTSMIDGVSRELSMVEDEGHDSGSDSYHSTVSYVSLTDIEVPVSIDAEHKFYSIGLSRVAGNSVPCRTLRTKLLGCSSDKDFLAKLYCIRLAFLDLLCVPATRQYFKDKGRQILSRLYQNYNKDTSTLVQHYDDLLDYSENNVSDVVEELKQRGVVDVSFYDVALDFILLDSFDDIVNPPAAITAVMQNRWLTSSMKQSAIATAVWSISKAKRSLLTKKDGFMSRFYLIGETMSPALVWGFLGTDNAFTQKCHKFKDKVVELVRSMFSLEKMHYTSQQQLADDISQLARNTCEELLATT